MRYSRKSRVRYEQRVYLHISGFLDSGRLDSALHCMLNSMESALKPCVASKESWASAAAAAAAAASAFDVM